LIRSPAFNRLAERTHSRVQKIKARYGGTEEELRQLKEQEKLLKETDEKIKTLDSETSRMFIVFVVDSRGRSWQVLVSVQGGVSKSE
jgi:hypothetical protein